MVKRKSNQNGFAALELLLIAVVLTLVGGVSYWVMNKSKQSQRANNGQSATAKLELDANLTGTSKGIETLAEYDVTEEQKAENELANQEQENALDDSAAVSGVGDGYEVSY